MNELLKRVIDFNAPADPEKVEELIKFLGDTPSLNTLNAVVEFYSEAEKNIRKKDLLEWMIENEQTSFETEDVKVAVKTFVNPKIMDEELGFQWLIDNQYGDLIQDTLAFPKGELNPKIEKKFEEMGLSYKKKSGVHYQTLKKHMSIRMETGELMPDWNENDPGDGIEVKYHDECVVKEK